MSTFKEIQGRNIRSYTTNPDNPLEGQMWYNQTELKLKGVAASGAWSSASPLATARYGGSGAGTQTAGLAFGGKVTTPNILTSTEEYNGSGWTSGGNLGNASYYGAGSGTQTAALNVDGVTPPNPPYTSVTTEEYDGSSWTAGGSLNTARYGGAGFGIQTASIAVTGSTGSISGLAEQYNGTAWTAIPSLNTARWFVGAAGTTTAGLVAGGQTPTIVNNAEEYNGSAWSEGNNLNTARAELSGSGLQTAGLFFGGITSAPAYTAVAETYDGTSFTEGPDMSTARGLMSPAQNGSSTATFGASGGTPSATAATEEYNKSINVITAAAWSSGGALPQGVSYNSGAGTQTAALSIAGQQPSTSIISNVYEYDGSSWADSGSPVNAFYGGATPPQSAQYMAAAGTQTAAIILGGGEATNVTVEYNGSSWTAGGTYPISQVAQSTMNGIQTAAINISGSGPPPGYTGVVANYNGSSWTASPVAFSPAGRRMSSAGTSTATIVSGGSNTGTITIAQEWDGSSWTTVGAPNSPQVDAKSTGIQTAALKMHGTSTESYNGSSWVTAASMANNRSLCTGGSSNDAGNTSAVVFGGSTPSFTSATEEFNGETTATNIVDITTS
jgi:hypothetical protein